MCGLVGAIGSMLQPSAAAHVCSACARRHVTSRHAPPSAPTPGSRPPHCTPARCQLASPAGRPVTRGCRAAACRAGRPLPCGAAQAPCPVGAWVAPAPASPRLRGRPCSGSAPGSGLQQQAGSSGSSTWHSMSGAVRRLAAGLPANTCSQAAGVEDTGARRAHLWRPHPPGRCRPAGCPGWSTRGDGCGCAQRSPACACLQGVWGARSSGWALACCMLPKITPCPGSVYACG
jgi:hypothetical protein